MPLLKSSDSNSVSWWYFSPNIKTLRECMRVAPDLKLCSRLPRLSFELIVAQAQWRKRWQRNSAASFCHAKISASVALNKCTQTNTALGCCLTSVCTVPTIFADLQCTVWKIVRCNKLYTSASIQLYIQPAFIFISSFSVYLHVLYSFQCAALEFKKRSCLTFEGISKTALFALHL